MNYHEFNIRIYNYYLENLIPGEYNSLTIPKSDFEDLIEDLDTIKSFKEIRNNDWSYLMKYDNNIPKYLGLLAIQCHAAFMMHKDNDWTAGNFRDRFISITGIESVQKLNQLFSENFDQKLNIQEKIWLNAKEYFIRKNIYIEIPELSRYAGRNTQFPESQSVLNYEDLKEYRTFYLHIYSNFETIYYDKFIEQYERFLPQLKYNFQRENNRKILLINQEKIKRRQIFDFYNTLDWLNFEKRQPRGKKVVEQYIAKLQDNIVSIYDEYFELLDNYSYLLDKQKLAVFSQDDIYTSEYIWNNVIALNVNYIILTPNIDYSKQLIDIGGREVELLQNTANVKAIVIEFKDRFPPFLYTYQSKEYPVRVIGKKISSKRQYLLSNLPRIEAVNGIQYRLYCDNRLIFENQPNKVGKYQIKVNGYSPYSFEVISEVVNDLIIEETGFKLQFNSLQYISEGQMKGFEISGENVIITDDFTINRWTKILNSKINLKRGSLSKFLLINVINQYKYGEDK